MNIQSTQKPTKPKCPWGSLLAMPAVLGFLIVGCQEPQKPAADAPRTAKHYPVRLDRGDNGAAVHSTAGPSERDRLQPRRLAFEITGFASGAPDGATQQEQRAAARQAAIIDALGCAVIESRRSRGLSVDDFTATLGPRLTLTHRTTDDGNEFEVRLTTRGLEKVLIVRNGVLQDLPNDFDLIHEVFAATHGEFSLLGAEPLGASGRQYAATVGCYVPAGLETAVAGNPSGADGDDPQADNLEE
ncbi:MAG: hypothetical protein ACE5E1_02045 [Phycisphaerae bacterium]